MQRILIPAAVLLAVLGLAMAALLLSGSHAEAPTAAGAQHLAAVAYPLYPGLIWGGERAASLMGFDGFEAESAPIMGVSDIASTTAGFEQYYGSKLAADGWMLDNALAAGGPGANVTGYRKGDAVFIYSYDTAFEGTQPGQPVECPCDVTFSVFSGAEAQ